MLGGRKLDPTTDFNGAFADPAVFAKKVHLLWIGVGMNEPERMHGLNGLHTSLQEAKLNTSFMNLLEPIMNGRRGVAI